MKTRLFTKLTILSLLAVIITPLAQAYEQPSVNLGFTSFMDGGPPAGPGWYFQQYVQYWSSDKFTDPNGNKAFPAELDAVISLTQMIYQSDKSLLGGTWGIDFILPYVNLDLDPGPTPLRAQSGMGDFLVGPYIQWGPIMGEKGPIFMHRVELQMIFPTGDYSRKYALNPSSNHFSFNPYWSGTLFMGPRWTASTRIHLLINEKNDAPAHITGLDDYQAGTSLHGNFAISYDVLPRQFRIGLNGYFFRQLENTKVNGHGDGSLDERVFAIGPGMLYSFSQDNHIFLNYYQESGAENRPEGWRLNARWTHHF